MAVDSEQKTAAQWAESLRIAPRGSRYSEGYNDGLADLLEKIEAAGRCGYGCNQPAGHEGAHLMPSAGIYP